MTAATAASLSDRRREWVEQNPLRKRRRELRLSLHATAATLPASVSALQQWESGAVRPGDESMGKIAEFLDVSIAALRGHWTRWERNQPR